MHFVFHCIFSEESVSQVLFFLVQLVNIDPHGLVHLKTACMTSHATHREYKSTNNQDLFSFIYNEQLNDKLFETLSGKYFCKNNHN